MRKMATLVSDELSVLNSISKVKYKYLILRK